MPEMKNVAVFKRLIRKRPIVTNHISYSFPREDPSQMRQHLRVGLSRAGRTRFYRSKTEELVFFYVVLLNLQEFSERLSMPEMKNVAVFKRLIRKRPIVTNHISFPWRGEPRGTSESEFTPGANTLPRFENF